MSQVNMLAIDLAKSVDSQATSTKNSNSDDAPISLFSDVMAKHQDTESGNDSQQSGKVNHEKSTNENSSNEKSSTNIADADQKIVKDNNSADESESAGNSDIETSQTESQKGDVENKNAVLIAEKSDGVQSKNSDDIAKKLLSFILASDEVSVEHINAKTKGEGKTNIDGEKVIGINTNVIDSANRSHEKAGKSSHELENTTNKVIDKTVSAESNSAKGEKNNVTDELKIPLNKVNQQITEGGESSKEAHLTLSTTAKSVKEAIFVNNSLGADANETKVDAGGKTTSTDSLVSGAINALNSVDGSIDESVSNEMGSETVENKNSLLEKLAQENKQSIKLNTEKSENIQQVTQVSGAVEVKGVEVNIEEIKNSSKNDQSLDRVINQTTTVNRSLSNASQSNGEQNQGQQQNQQSNEQSHSLSKSESEQVKDIQQVIAKNEQETDFNEKMINSVNEKSTLQSTISEAANHQMLSQQSLNYAEEQAIQSNIAKATADSISVQSAKTAFNIQVETVSINRKDFADAVKDKVMVMINQKIKQLEIRLDPPELGSMHVKLNLQNEQAAVNFVVQNQQAKEALEQNMDKLKDMLAQSGVDVGDANIEQRNQQTDEGNDASQQQGNGSQLSGQESGEDEIAMSGANLYKASASGVDYYA
jgi:flagellar hook-length control protein FliK